MLKQKSNLINVQAKSCRVMIDLTHENDGHFGDTFDKAGAFIAILAAMKHSPRHIELQCYGCGTLCILTVHHVFGSKKVFEVVGLVRMVLAVMKCYP
jgi:hypothetical protein